MDSLSDTLFELCKSLDSEFTFEKAMHNLTCEENARLKARISEPEGLGDAV